MSNKPWDQSIINPLERPLSIQYDLIGSYGRQTLADLLYRTYASRLSMSSDLPNYQPPVGRAGFLGSAFKCRSVTGALQVSLDAGLGFFNDNTQVTNIGNVNGVNDQALIKPLVLTANEVINVPAADPVNPRIDVIEVQSGRQLTDATSRDVFNPSAAAFQPNVVNTTLTYALNGRTTINGAGPINYKTGAPNASPSAPAADSGYTVIGQVYVPANASSLGATSMMDLRRMLFPGGTLRVSGYCASPSGGPGGVLRTLDAPPGVEVSILNTVGEQFLYVKAGDATQFRTDYAPFLDVGGIAMVIVGNGNAVQLADLNLIQAATAFNALSAAQANPPMNVMVGQPLLTTALGVPGSSGTSFYQFALTAQY